MAKRKETTDSNDGPKVMFLEVVWNLAVVTAGIAILCTSVKEHPNKPLRAWVIVFTVEKMVVLVLGCICFLAWPWETGKVLRGITFMFEKVWMVIGFYWINKGGDVLKHNAPSLYRSTIVFACSTIASAFFIYACMACFSCCCGGCDGGCDDSEIKQENNTNV